MNLLASAVLVFLGLVFAVPICAGPANWLLGDPMDCWVFLFPMIVMVAAGAGEAEDCGVAIQTPTMITIGSAMIDDSARRAMTHSMSKARRPEKFAESSPATPAIAALFS